MADAGGRAGIIIFTLWYVGIAYLYYTDHYQTKEEEGSQTHTKSDNSSQNSNKSRNILEQAVDILEEHVEQKLNGEPESELEDKIISLVKSPADVQSESDFEEAAESDNNYEPIPTSDKQDAEENFDESDNNDESIPTSDKQDAEENYD